MSWTSRRISFVWACRKPSKEYFLFKFMGNALLTRQGGQVFSVDPLYRFSDEDLRIRINETYADVMNQVRKNRNEFIWTSIKSVDELGSKLSRHLKAITEILCDMGYDITIERVPYEFQRGGNEIMKIKNVKPFAPPDPKDLAVFAIR